MIHLFNRCELASCFNMEQCQAIEKALRDNQIPYHTKVIDRSSPSAFSMGARERGGTLFHDMAQNWRYVIYVKRKDREAALDCTGLRPIR